MWALGDGLSIRPFADAWITTDFQRRLGQHPITRQQAGTRVADWITQLSRSWNQAAIGEALLEDEATLITAIPIPIIPHKDEIRWPFDRGAKLTARSAYHFLQEAEGDHRTETM